MHFPQLPRFVQLRFSLRTLLIAFAVVGILFALSIQFGPHLLWKTVASDYASGVEPIPIAPLVDTPPDCELVRFQVGPLSLELPKSMTSHVEVQRGMGGAFVIVSGDGRSVVLMLPKPDKHLFEHELAAFPDKAELSFPRLRLEVAKAKSSDFSWTMSRRELALHAWMLTYRWLSDGVCDSIEYVWRPELDGNLLLSSSVDTFEWTSTDRKWEGMIHLRGRTPESADWVRHACATFSIGGDCGVLQNLDDDAIKSLITITDVDDTMRDESPTPPRSSPC
jgi:hypothetical protein